VKKRTLKEARTDKGLTQEQLEQLSGVSQAVISKIERGEVLDPASSTVLKLAEALSIDPRILRFGQSESMAS
jgi:transcriptional regulator with XRE-family HTH domain